MMLPLICLCVSTGVPPLRAGTSLMEAEQFRDKGGWEVDTQFIESMGSPYLIAHGMGTPVKDAVTEAEVEEAGTYRVWVRTLDWTKRLGREGAAGRFQVVVDGKPLVAELGKGAEGWTWQEAGKVELAAGYDLVVAGGGYGGRSGCWSSRKKAFPTRTAGARGGTGRAAMTTTRSTSWS